MRPLAVCLALIAACAAPGPQLLARPFELRAVTRSGEALPGLRAWLDGVPLGETQSDGVLHGTLRGRVHQRVMLSWACPAAHEPSSEQRELSIDAGGPRPSAYAKQGPALLKLEARCSPLEIQAALVVRAPGAPAEGLPIIVRDEVVARTDAEGLAHVVLRARRGSSLAVALDTSAHPRLVPASPIETFQLGSDDTILLLDRKLETAASKSKTARGPKPKEPETRKPVRIQ
jgi:hypothetical protein